MRREGAVQAKAPEEEDDIWEGEGDIWEGVGIQHRGGT